MKAEIINVVTLEGERRPVFLKVAIKFKGDNIKIRAYDASFARYGLSFEKRMELIDCNVIWLEYNDIENLASIVELWEKECEGCYGQKYSGM